MQSRSKRIDKLLMERCIDLAKKGAGCVSPNPMVGCVITKNGRKISEGYHQLFGSNHAEINAIQKATLKNIDLKGSTLYTNLEPCNHYGKTPPCVDKIIGNKIKKVVVGSIDPNPLVSGKGIKKLIQNGISVRTGVLEKECKSLNKFYFKNIKTHLPYVTLKSAQTLDGKIADEKGNSKWISSLESRKRVHKLRSQYDAVLVGRNTVEIDNPKLTVRLIKGRNPFRIIIDTELKLNFKKTIFNDTNKNKTIILCSERVYSGNLQKRRLFEKKGLKIISVKAKNGVLNLKDALKKLSSKGISSILVEGGAITFSEFLKQDLVDEIIIFIAPKIMGNGIKSFNYSKNIKRKFLKKSWSISGKDLLINLRRK